MRPFAKLLLTLVIIMIRGQNVKRAKCDWWVLAEKCQVEKYVLVACDVLARRRVRGRVDVRHLPRRTGDDAWRSSVPPDRLRPSQPRREDVMTFGIYLEKLETMHDGRLCRLTGSDPVNHVERTCWRSASTSKNWRRCMMVVCAAWPAQTQSTRSTPSTSTAILYLSTLLSD